MKAQLNKSKFKYTPLQAFHLLFSEFNFTFFHFIHLCGLPTPTFLFSVNMCSTNSTIQELVHSIKSTGKFQL
jgi:hypothetical protein